MARLFVAADLSVNVVERLVLLQRHVEAAQLDRVRWVEPGNIHVTLKFLGEVGEELVPFVSEVLRDLSRPLFPFEVTCCRLDAFPDLEQPQVLWAGLDASGAEVMGLLRQTIEQGLSELGFAPDARPFVPHLTLGRVKGTDAVQLVEEVKRHRTVDFGVSYVKDLVLFESVRTPRGTSYLVRERFSLGEQ